MIETTIIGLKTDELENIQVLYKKKILKTEAKATELALELETMKGVLEAVKQLQRDRNEESQEDWEKDNGLDKFDDDCRNEDFDDDVKDEDFE